VNAGAIWVALVPAAVSALAIAILRRSRWSSRLADHPNERSLHTQPRPRLGGLGIAAGLLPVAVTYGSGGGSVILACALGLCIVSLMDDLRALPAALRLSAHLLAALVVMSAIAYVPAAAPPWAWLCWLTVLVAIVWITNLYNFMDGADGLAGTMAVVGFGAYAIAAGLAGEQTLALISLATASASAGFLVHNFPPARVFMGDAGSIPLGFLAAALGIQGYVAGTWPAAFPVLVFSPFIVDATVTLLRRLARGERVWKAHRTHLYQRLVLSGWSARQLALRAAGLMLAVAASALVLARSGFMLQCGIIFFWAAVYALIFPALDRKAKTNTNTAR
jgi:UDP-GlcNAc:undecaprenyl-phosphate GlcNAc-1-phosphate transferase